MVAFIEPATIRRDGVLRSVWSIEDLSVTDDRGIRSYRSLLDYDCGAKKYRVRFRTGHADRMGEGFPKRVEREPGPFVDVPHNSQFEGGLEAVCSS